MSKRVYLVTGAAGFLGGTVCRQLINKGEKVRAFVLPNDPAMKFVPAGVEIVEGDLCDMDSLKKLFEAVDDSTDENSNGDGAELIVLHIASIVTVNPEYNQKVMDVNVGGTKNIIECCRNYNVSKLVYCSSTGAIPEQEKGIKISETKDFTTLDPTKVVGCYSQSKAMATKHVLDAANTGLNACVVHPSGIMGPEDFAMGETTKTLIKIMNGEMPVGIDGSFNLCDVRDLAAGLISAVDNGKSGECYILGNDPVSFKDFAKLVKDESGCKGIKFFLPISMANALANLMEKKAKKKGEKPVMTKFSVYNLARNNWFDSGKAMRELKYQTRSYRETISDEIRWLRKEGLIA